MKNDIVVAPSLISADMTALGAEIERMLNAGADWIHFDSMDMHFVPNLSLGPLVLKSLHKAYPQVFWDVHIMASPVESLIDSFAAAGASQITIHYEANTFARRSLEQIKHLGISAGIAYNPATPLSSLPYLIDLVDLVLIMTVNPGFGGQEFIPLYSKIKDAAEIIAKHNLASPKSIRLEVDGGVNSQNSKKIIAAGADTLVAGTAIFSSKDMAGAVTAIRGK